MTNHVSNHMTNHVTNHVINHIIWRVLWCSKDLYSKCRDRSLITGILGISNLVNLNLIPPHERPPSHYFPIVLKGKYFILYFARVRTHLLNSVSGKETSLDIFISISQYIHLFDTNLLIKTSLTQSSILLLFVNLIKFKRQQCRIRGRIGNSVLA